MDKAAEELVRDKDENMIVPALKRKPINSTNDSKANKGAVSRLTRKGQEESECKKTNQTVRTARHGQISAKSLQGNI